MCDREDSTKQPATRPPQTREEQESLNRLLRGCAGGGSPAAEQGRSFGASVDEMLRQPSPDPLGYFAGAHAEDGARRHSLQERVQGQRKQLAHAAVQATQQEAALARFLQLIRPFDYTYVEQLLDAARVAGLV